MKIIVSSIAFATLLTSVTITSAQPYLTADGGAILQQDSVVHENIGGAQVLNEHASYNPGYRFDLSAGDDINPWVAAEINGGYMWDSINKVGGQSLAAGEKADFYSFPILGNLIFKIPNPTPLVPYFGIGGGAVVSIFDYKSTAGDYSPNDVEPAVQGQAGVKFILCRNASLGVAYKFMATFDERYNGNTDLGEDHYRFDDIFIHGVFANFTLTF
jgi:Outer membrane protein beta-barrel domain